MAGRALVGEMQIPRGSDADCRGKICCWCGEEKSKEDPEGALSPLPSALGPDWSGGRWPEAETLPHRSFFLLVAEPTSMRTHRFIL